MLPGQPFGRYASAPSPRYSSRSALATSRARLPDVAGTDLAPDAAVACSWMAMSHQTVQPSLSQSTPHESDSAAAITRPWPPTLSGSALGAGGVNPGPQSWTVTITRG